MSEPTYTSRFPPCPIYDIESMESWLEDLARQGLILSKGGLFCGFAEFEKTTPRAVRYRLQPLPKKKLLADSGPEAAAVELAEAYGWSFRCVMGEFAVYAAEDPHVPELNTDPQIQALALKQLYRRRRNDCIATVLWGLLFLGLLLWTGPVSFLLRSQPWYLWTMALVWLVYPFTVHSELRQLRMLRKKLTMNEPLDRQVDWRKRRWQHWLSAVFTLLLAVGFFSAALLADFVDWTDNRWTPLEEYTEPLPFARMEDLAGGGTFVADGYFLDEDNHIARRGTLLAPRQMELQQFGQVLQHGETVLSGSLQVDYYELRTPWLARLLYAEILRSDDDSKHYHPLDLPALDVEQASAYSNFFPTLLLQDGNRVLRIRFSQFEEDLVHPLSQWSATAADHLRDSAN